MSEQKNYTAAEVQKLLVDNAITLIDVREPAERTAEYIAGSLAFPLSAFNPAALPNTGKPIVFHCAGGVRSVTSINKCRAENLPHTAHMAGGIHAWKQAGFPTITAISP